MGGNDSKPQCTEDNPKINHYIFEKSKFYKNNDQEYIEINLPLPSEKQFQNWLKFTKKAPHNEGILLPLQYSFSKQGYCGTSGFANIKYEHFPFMLSDQINNRISLENKLFEQTELWYLAYTLLSVGQNIHSQGLKIGDVRPDNIFINEQGQVKIGTIYSWPGQQNNYLKTFYQHESTYLSPEQMKDMQYGKIQSSADLQLSETFTIGLTILDAATLSSSKSLYSKNMKFDYHALQKCLTKLKQFKYSQIFTIFVENMCEIDENYREKCSILYEWLKPYEQSIINLEDFEVNGIPQKIAITLQKYYNPSQKNSQIHYVASQNSRFNQNEQQLSQNRNMLGQKNNYFIKNQNQKKKYENVVYTDDHQNRVPHPQYFLKANQLYYTSHHPQYVNTMQEANHPYKYSQYQQQQYQQLQYQRQQYQQPQYQQSHPQYQMLNNIASSGVNLEKIDQQLQLSRKMFP